MKGSAKQVAWAEQIVGNIISHIEKKQVIYTQHGNTDLVQLYERMKNEIMDAVEKMDAGEIINKRGKFDADRIDRRIAAAYEQMVA